MKRPVRSSDQCEGECVCVPVSVSVKERERERERKRNLSSVARTRTDSGIIPGSRPRLDIDRSWLIDLDWGWWTFVTYRISHPSPPPPNPHPTLSCRRFYHSTEICLTSERSQSLDEVAGSCEPISMVDWATKPRGTVPERVGHWRVDCDRRQKMEGVGGRGEKNGPIRTPRQQQNGRTYK